MNEWSPEADPQAPGTGARAAESVDVVAAIHALTNVNREMELLKSELDSIVSLVRQALSLGAPQTEFESMFVRAQQFVERTVADAEQKRVEILTNAYIRADEVVAEARRHATDLAARASSYVVIAPQALEELERTIDSFTQANDELTREFTSRRH
ncbi:MAG: hypothetical protein ACRDV4_12280 [Acidimicrobiales bacterium]